ncbi:hypothetical protein FRC01_000390, partial [Tulasnella sp. 417]
MHDLPGDASGSEDVDFNEIWFANQLIHNACATQAILNVIFNCPQLDIGAKLRNFKDFTRNMGPKMKGLALSNDLGIRDIHNSMARPADLQDALHSLAKRTALTDAEKKRAAERAKRKSKTAAKKKKKADEDEDDDDDSGDTVYHYVGYVPFKGKVWELDGLRVGPLEVGEIPPTTQGNGECSQEWLEVVRPAIRIKIESLQGSGHDIRFNLLALVEGGWEKRSDEFELLRRERRALERRLDGLDPDWKTKLEDPTLYSTAEAMFSDRADPGGFNPSFGFLSSERSMRVLRLPEDQILQEWLRCCRDAQSVTMLLREEQEKAQTWATEKAKRTHNFENFFQAFAEALHGEVLIIEKTVALYICIRTSLFSINDRAMDLPTPELSPGGPENMAVNILSADHHHYSTLAMSTRPRPRPRPRSKASKESATQAPSSQEASTSFAVAPGKVDDVVKEVAKEEVKKPEPVNPALAYFMMNKKNNARQKVRGSATTKQQREQGKMVNVEYDLDQDVPEPESPTSKRKLKDSVLPTAPKTQLPLWARDARNISPVVSDADSEIEIIEVRESSDDDDLSPRTKRARLASREPPPAAGNKRKDKQKARKRSSSPEIIEPPTLTAADLADAQATFRSYYPRPAPRASSPDLLADRSTDSIAGLNPELQELAKKVRKNVTRAGSEAASGKPEVVIIRVVYHPHPQETQDSNPNKAWAFKMKRTDELKPVFEKVAAA